MKVIIVEDEYHNFKLLKGMIERLRPAWQILQSFEDVRGTVDWLKANPAPDLIFLDIQLSDDNCFSIFSQVEVKSMVIFTTAYDEYAMQAFKVNSIDYLLKPIKSGELEQAILKFERVFRQAATHPDYKKLLDEIATNKKKFRKRFLISGPTSYHKVNVADIAFFHTENRVTFAVTFKNKRHILDLTLENLEEQLDPDQFFRANRSHIINNEAIHKIENYFGSKLLVKLVPPFKETITISRLKATLFKNWLDG
ncbi:MAG: LytTR family DNA-binding domain-containing protein [Cytophagales bacterium]|nr:LytTR family DNA-binding domain-containing protein [Cytophagales bacterium]